MVEQSIGYQEVQVHCMVVKLKNCLSLRSTVAGKIFTDDPVKIFKPGVLGLKIAKIIGLNLVNLDHFY